MATETTHAMRSHELSLAAQILPKGAKVLELGAGDGWQAAQLSAHGFVVTALDVAGSPQNFKQYFPVTRYDGTTLPFADCSFDAIYSSNVLEHIANFDRIQTELARVLKPSGVAVHCVPSASWRLWTTLGHPIYAARWALGWLIAAVFPRSKSSMQQTAAHLSGKSTLRLLRLGFFPTRHGEHGNWLSEHYLFSRRSWIRRFSRAGWATDSVFPSRLLYSGNEIFGLGLSISSRVRLASFLGSSTFVFILHPSRDSGNADIHIMANR
jgi:SAM-dependent methyltransferase